MLIEKKEFWFIVGSQKLYGDNIFSKITSNAEEIVDNLNTNNSNYAVKLKEIAVDYETITDLMLEANFDKNVAGVITWMHTFSPAKMWIRGTQILQKPLLHFATQYHAEIPWNTIDMDYMNLNQSAHGDREYAYINARLNKNNEIVFGHWQDKEVQYRIFTWMKAAVAYNESFNIKVARFGDNMRNVAVTEGDKIEAQIKFGWRVDYFGIGDLVEYIENVTNEEIEAVFKEYKELYDFDYTDYDKDVWERQVKTQAKQEIALQRFLDEGGYTAFTTNFEDLHGLEQLPGLSVQRLMMKGYGFAAEGDWKTAALNRLLKIMSNNKSTGFMEDYTYNFANGSEMILQSHMMEVDPTLAINKPQIVVSPLSMGNKSDPARLVFDGKSGEGVVVTVADFGDDFKFIVSDVEAIEANVKTPFLPVAKVIWNTKPNLKEGVESWLKEGGGHHTVVSLDLTTHEILSLLKLFEVPIVHIN